MPRTTSWSSKRLATETDRPNSSATCVIVSSSSSSSKRRVANCGSEKSKSPKARMKSKKNSRIRVRRNWLRLLAMSSRLSGRTGASSKNLQGHKDFLSEIVTHTQVNFKALLTTAQCYGSGENGTKKWYAPLNRYEPVPVEWGECPEERSSRPKGQKLVANYIRRFFLLARLPGTSARVSSRKSREHWFRRFKMA